MDENELELVMRMIYVEGGVWATRPVEEQPSIHLARWSIWQVATGGETSLHFVGYNLDDSEGRVSSAITEFNQETRRGRTSSGRVYELIGPPGHDSDGLYVWERWTAARPMSCRDITAKVLNGESEAVGR